MIDFPGKAKVIPPRDVLLLPYQKRWVEDMHRMKLCEKSRQIGFTWCSSYAVSKRHAIKGARLDTWATSRDEIQAGLFVQDVKGFANLLDIGAKDLGEKVLDDKGQSARVLKFDTNTSVYSMSSNPDAQAGKRGHRLADEFGLHRDPRLLYQIMKPGVTWGGMLEIFSTHRGSKNYFNELVVEIKHKGNPKNFSLHTVTLKNALDEGFLYKLQKKLFSLDPSDERIYMDEGEYFDSVRNEMPDEESFLQEMMCIPADDATAFLDYEMITACEYGPLEKWEGLTGKLYVGVDVGRVHDLTVIWVLEKVNDTFFTRKVIELKNTRFAEQEEILYKILELPNMVRCCIDNTGLGRQFGERAQERFGSYKVEPITFTMASKEEMAYPLRSVFEDGRIRIPEHKNIRADLRAIKKIQTSGDHVRFAADRGANGHSDRFWSLALAVLAGKSLPIEYGFESVGEKAETFGL